MNEKKIRSDQQENLRRRAEEIARHKDAEAPGQPKAPSAEEARQTLHELRVHQIELEMQNEELRRTQAELEASRARYFDLYDLAPVGYLTLSETGMILEANLNAAGFLGVARTTLAKHPLSHFFLPEDQDVYYRHHRQLIETGARQVCELRMLRADSAHFWARLEETAVQGGYATPAFLVVVSDISESKRAEVERQKIDAQLLQAQKMQSVGRLAGGVAHEFNNMLQVINSHAELALGKLTASDPLFAHLQAIAKAGWRSAGFVRQLLAFAREQPIAPQILALNKIIPHMLEILQGLIGADVDLLWRSAPDLWSVKMDRAQVDQILANLVVNARDAISGAGKITIETDMAEFDEAYCRTHPGFLPGQHVLLAVSDSGSGMDKETQSHIFEPFFSTKPFGQATGFGLSTVYGIVKQNLGFIIVRSAPGEGTTFNIYLPRQEAAAQTIDETRMEKELPTGTETVLLVDEEGTLLLPGRMLLEGLGYHVLAAGSPLQGMQLAEKYKGVIHLLLTDVVMPEMSGRDLWKQLHALRPGMKCLIMSGYAPNVIARRDLLEEDIHFLQKPFSREALAVKLRETLSAP